MNEYDIREFWNAHPCGDHIVGGLHGEFADDYERFFAAYDAWRYDQEAHIPACLDRFDFRDRRVLEIGLGQGAESEQIIRRGGRWSGLDLTRESVDANWWLPLRYSPVFPLLRKVSGRGLARSSQSAG